MNDTVILFYYIIIFTLSMFLLLGIIDSYSIVGKIITTFLLINTIAYFAFNIK